MKIIVTAAVLALTGFAGVAGAEAQDHRDRGQFQHQDHHRVSQVRRQPRYVPAPRMERVFVPARYERRIIGYDHCRQPIYATICVSAGYWTTAPDRCD